MNEIKAKSSRQPPWESGGESESGTFGAWLRRERQARQVSLDEIAEVTKIGKVYLQALEQERFDLLPAPVFAKGFLREYAKYVGLDPDQVVNSYISAASDAEGEAALEEPSSSSGSSFEWTSGVLLAAALILLLAGIGFVGFWTERSQESRSPQAPSSAPAPVEIQDGRPASASPAEDAAPGPVAAGAVEGLSRADAAAFPAVSSPARETPLAVTIDFTEDCWVEATVDGRRRLSELRIQGESMLIDAQSRVELTLGNPAAVSIEVNGEPYPLREYRPGRVARDIVIELEDAG